MAERAQPNPLLVQFLEERRAALLSMDEGRIKACALKYGVQTILGVRGELFWVVIHKARTAALDLPESARQESRSWLREHGYKPWLREHGYEVMEYEVKE